MQTNTINCAISHFIKTYLCRYSAFVNWISVRFYEMGCRSICKQNTMNELEQSAKNAIKFNFQILQYIVQEELQTEIMLT